MNIIKMIYPGVVFPCVISIAKNLAKGFILFLLPVCIPALLLSACPEHFNLPEDGFGKLTVTLSTGNPRTVFPTRAFDNYVYTFTKSGETTGVELTPDSDGNFTLETGEWTVEVEAYAGTVAPANLAAVSTPAEFTITANSPTNVTVRLAGIVSSGTGTFTYNITFPSGANVETLTLLKLPELNVDYAPNMTKTSTTAGATTNVPAGYYLLTVKLKYGGKEAGLIETVHIYNNLATAYTKAFTDADFIPAEFYSAAHFTDWLASKPANTANTPYDAALIVSSAYDIDGFNTQFINNGKYVNLDLSGSTITTIPGSAFQNCAALTGITLPDSVTTIGQNAFNGCTNLKTITIKVTAINGDEFGAGNNWGNIFPASGLNVTFDADICDYAFFNCTRLTSVTIGSGVESIGIGAFYNCGLTGSITIPASVTAIGNEAFYGCSSLASVTFAAGSALTTIGTSAFEGCSQITSVTIPAGVTTIGTQAFRNCTSLTSVTFTGDTITSFLSNSFPQGTTGAGGDNLKTAYQAATGGAGTYRREPNGVDWTRSSIEDTLVFVQGGTFEIGRDLGTEATGDTNNPHMVTLSGFYIGSTEVTQAQWLAVMGMTIVQQQALGTASTTIYGRSDDHPIYYVNWYETLVFCNKLSMTQGLTPAYSINNSTNPNDWGDVPDSETASNKEAWDAVEVVIGSKGYRLPTEAQWEYAAKGGDPTAAGWVGYTYAGSDTVGDVAWYEGNDDPHAAKAVGTKDANGLGLYDMSGNMFEWCWDWYATYSSGAQTDPMGPSSDSQFRRAVRGGYYESPAENVRIARRSYHGTGIHVRSSNFGFRIVRPAN